MSSRPVIRIFRYVEPLDAFVVTDEYRAVADTLGLSEWNPVVWIGRLFTMDNDLGEHWFDNWDEREALEPRAAALGLDSHDLMILDPRHFMDGKDGPCHSDEFRKRFWTDVLKSLELSYDLLFDEARKGNEYYKVAFPEDYIEDLEERIRRIQTRLSEVP